MMKCKFCYWSGDRDELFINYEVDPYHPHNRKLYKGHPDLHKSKYEECPNCGAAFFEDNRPMPWLELSTVDGGVAIC